MKKSCWKKSQTSSGYYKKSPNQMVKFIRFDKNDNGSYNIQFRKGLGGTQEFRTIAKAPNKTIAIKKAKSYMKENNKC